MGDWHCFKCKERMIEDGMTLMYLEIDAIVDGLVCPVCGEGYITEEIAVGKLAAGEKKIEDK
jgi:YgiT-type zinc finger domain-containing protein